MVNVQVYPTSGPKQLNRNGRWILSLLNDEERWGNEECASIEFDTRAMDQSMMSGSRAGISTTHPTFSLTGTSNLDPLAQSEAQTTQKLWKTSSTRTTHPITFVQYHDPFLPLGTLPPPTTPILPLSQETLPIIPQPSTTFHRRNTPILDGYKYTATSPSMPQSPPPSLSTLPSRNPSTILNTFYNASDHSIIASSIVLNSITSIKVHLSKYSNSLSTLTN